MTDFREYTMLSPGKLAKFIGFTQDEVKQICKENKLNFSRTKKWYDGYSFTGLKSIYNPNSVMEAVRKGKGMPGHMGAKRITVQNLEVVRADAEKNIILVKGSVPGPKKALITLKESTKA